MSRNKKLLVPGKTLTLRLPMEISKTSLNYLNNLDQRNTEILNLIENAANKELLQDNSSISVNLDYNLSIDERKFLEDQTTQKSIAAFITMLIGGSSSMPVQLNEKDTNKSLPATEDFSAFDNLLDVE